MVGGLWYNRVAITMFDINTSWLKLSYFTLTHKEDFRKWYIIVLLALAVFMSVFVITNTVLYFIGGPLNSRLVLGMVEDTVDYAGIRARSVPTHIAVPETFVIPAGESRLDLVAPVTNPNSDWFATVTYSTSLSGRNADPLHVVINPQSEGYLTAFGLTGSDQSNAQMIIERIDWQRVDHRQPPPEINFRVDNINYSILTAAGTTVHQITADITNASFTSFFEVPFIVLLYRGDQIVGVQYTDVAPFDVSSTQSISVKLGNVAGTVTGTKIAPVLNLLDRSNMSAAP